MMWQRHGKQAAPEDVWILVHAPWRTVEQCPFVLVKRIGDTFVTEDMAWAASPDDWWCSIPRGGK
jgi:hypothetical protein